MVVLILQFRSQEKATKEEAYQKILDDYSDIIRTLGTRPELTGLLDDLVKSRTGTRVDLARDVDRGEVHPESLSDDLRTTGTGPHAAAETID